MGLGNCLERALALVRGDRGRDYGRPRDDYGRTAALWSAYLGVPITAEQAAVCMILVKVSRLAHSPGHTDSIIDIAGYAAVVEDCADAAKMDAVSTAADAVVQAGKAASAMGMAIFEELRKDGLVREDGTIAPALAPDVKAPKSRQALFEQLRDIAVELRGSIVIDWPTGIEAGGSTVGGGVKVRIEASMDELLKLDLRASKRGSDAPRPEPAPFASGGPVIPRESNPFVRLCRVAGILRDAIGPSPGETIEGTAERAASLLRPKKPKLSEVVPFAIVVPYEGLCGIVCPKDSTNGWLVEYRNGEWRLGNGTTYGPFPGDRFVQINWRSIFEGGAS